MNEKNIRYCAALLTCTGLLSGCGLWSHDDPEDTLGHAGSVAGAGVGGGTAQGGSTNRAGGPNQAGFGGDISFPTCSGPVPATSQIPRLLDHQYEAVIRDLLGVTTLPGDQRRLRDFMTGNDDGPMTAPAWEIYQDLAEKISHAVMTGPNKSKFISCNPADAGCMDDTIKNFGRKAFRRPLSEDEVARLQKLGQTTPAPTPDEFAETTLYAFLVSPSFLMLPELALDNPAAGSPGSVQLSSHEVATRLSILLWGSIPDDELSAAADKNELQTKEQILTQAQRMLVVREKTAPMIEAFHQRWLLENDTNQLWGKTKHDPATFPLFTENAIPVMLTELDAFFDDVTFGAGTFKDYFLSSVAFVNRDTAAIYGLDPARYGSELTRVELDAKQRPGFVTRAAFLSSYSNYDQTNPFRRGGFISRNLLGIAIPPDPDQVRSGPDGFKTNREYAEALTSPQPCKGCHEVFNPAGFALENYDAIGAWQTVDPRGGTIDATATVQRANSQGSIQVNSPLELMQVIANDPTAKRLYAEAWVSFAFGRPLTSEHDRCVADVLTSHLQASDYRVLSVPAELTQAESFRTRVRGTP